MRRGILERFRAAYGDRPFALLPAECASNCAISSSVTVWNPSPLILRCRMFAVGSARSQPRLTGIEALLDAKPPHAARSCLVTLRSLCQFAHHPIGTKPRLAFALLLYTAQRRSDVVRMGRQHIRDGVLTVKQQKTGITLAIPVHPHLQTVLDATPSEHLTFLVTATGKPYGGNAFSEQFRNWCDAAGLPQRCKPHGLRKAACRRLAEHGCSANEIMAISGHTTMKEIVRYTVAADQAKLARNAMNRSQSFGGGAASTPTRR